MTRRWWEGLGFGALVLCSGCYRAASVHPSELQQFDVDRGSAALVYKNGDSRRITRFDTITVETNALTPEATPADGAKAQVQSECEFEFEFGRMTRGSMSTARLQLETQHYRHVFSLAQVESITLEKYSPERPWLILAAAGVGAVAGGLLGYASGGPCNGEWGCFEKGMHAVVGVPIGFGVGLALGFPLTRGLGTLTRARPVQSNERFRSWTPKGRGEPTAVVDGEAQH